MRVIKGVYISEDQFIIPVEDEACTVCGITKACLEVKDTSYADNYSYILMCPDCINEMWEKLDLK